MNPIYVPFRDAVHFQDRNRKWSVVHGQIVVQKGETATYKMHAWCESNGMVYDPTFDLLLPRSAYYRMNQVLETQINRYTYPQVLQKLQETRRYARWE